MKLFSFRRKRTTKNHFLLNFNNAFCITLLALPLLLLAFQNCKSNVNQTPNLFSEQTPSNDKGYIIAYLSSEDETIVTEDQFLIDSNVKLKAMYSHSDSENFKWKITRAFETITDGEETTTEPEYQYQFKQSGSYDIFAISHKSSDLLTLASKRLVIGEECLVTDIIEQFYYNYCPSGGSYCYFSGPLPGPLSYQTCENSILSQTVTRNPSSVVNGECNNSIKNACVQGTLNDIDDSETHYQWQCVGWSGGTTGSCTKAKTIDGQFNNAVVNGCNSGTLQDLFDSATEYLWYCVGSGG